MSSEPTGTDAPSCCSMRPARRRAIGNAAAADADEHEVGDAAVALHDLVGDAGHRATQVIGVEDAAFGHASPWRPRRTALKGSPQSIPMPGAVTPRRRIHLVEGRGAEPALVADR